MSARAPAEKVLDVTNLSVTYRTDSGPVAAVHGLSFSIGRGEALGLVGESGSGKSTVAAAVLGLLPHGAGRASGRMALEGIVLPAAGAARRRLLGDQIGAVFQDPFTSFNPGLRVGEQVAESLRYKRGLSRALARRRVIDLLEQTGIRNAADAANAYPHQLSGGMRQRALIAAAIACEPPLLILDEPTTALDVTIQAQILDLLATLRRERGMSLLFISHNLAVVRRVCDRVLVLYAGRLMECGSASELFARPRHPYARGLLAAIPDLSARRSRRLAAIPGSLPNAGKAVRAHAVLEVRLLDVSLADAPSKTLAVTRVNKVYEGRPHIVDAMKDGAIDLVFNTTEGAQALKDSHSIRRTALMQKIPYYTTVAGSQAAVQAIQALRDTTLGVAPLQAYAG